MNIQSLQKLSAAQVSKHNEGQKGPWGTFRQVLEGLNIGGLQRELQRDIGSTHRGLGKNFQSLLQLQMTAQELHLRTELLSRVADSATTTLRKLQQTQG